LLAAEVVVAQDMAVFGGPKAAAAVLLSINQVLQLHQEMSYR
jgi:hypothetical protein